LFQAIQEHCCSVTLSLKRKRISRACVDNEVDNQMFMLPVNEAEALNIVSWSSMLGIWRNGYAFVLNVCRWHLRKKKAWTELHAEIKAHFTNIFFCLFFFAFRVSRLFLCQNAVLDLL
jgi:hypothetical protein